MAFGLLINTCRLNTNMTQCTLCSGSCGSPKLPSHPRQRQLFLLLRILTTSEPISLGLQFWSFICLDAVINIWHKHTAQSNARQPSVIFISVNETLCIMHRSPTPKSLNGFNVKLSTSLIMHSDMCLGQRRRGQKGCSLNLLGDC